MTEFFDRNGKRMSLMQWAKAWENMNYRVLGSHTVGNLWVSTVWLGIDHDVLNAMAMRETPMPPMIFESIIFAVPESDDRWEALEMRRYRTEHEAMVGHTDFVHMANVMTDMLKEVIEDGEPADPAVHKSGRGPEPGEGPGLDDDGV